MSNPNPAQPVIRVLRCPWCGGPASTDSWHTGFRGDDSGLAWIIECSNPRCGASGPIGDTMGDAVTLWNRVAARAGVLIHDPA